MKKFLAFSLLASVAFVAAPAHAQTPAAPAAATANPVTDSLRLLQPRQQKKTIDAIELMPADKFGFKPTPEMNSFGHLVVHIAQFNYSMCATVAGVEAPKMEFADTDPKEKLLAGAKASFDFCTQSLAKVDDSHLGDNLDFGFAKGPRALGVLILASAWADHYSEEAIYLRLNGVLPPTAKPKN
jgi:hypothetical protein